MARGDAAKPAPTMPVGMKAASQSPSLDPVYKAKDPHKISYAMKIKNVTLAVYCVLAYCQCICSAQTPGYVIEWGWNTAAGAAVPAQVVLSNAIAISAGRIQCLALKDDGTVTAWKRNCHSAPKAIQGR